MQTKRSFYRQGEDLADPKAGRFRRLAGLALGLALALTYGLLTQALVRWEMPGVPLSQPPLGAAGNILLWAAIGALLGLAVAWPEEPLYGILLGAGLGTVIVSGFNFALAAQAGGGQDVSIWARLLTFIFTFLPIAGMLALLMVLLRWAVNRLAAAFSGGQGFWRALWPPVLLLVLVVGLGLATRLSTRARQDLLQTHALIQAGLNAPDRQSLPEALREKRVGDFIRQAAPEYSLERDTKNILRYGLPRPAGSQLNEEAVVVARFANDWGLACLFAASQAEPICRSLGADTGEAFYLETAPQVFEVDWDDFSYFEQGLVAGEPTSGLPLPGAPVYHVELNLPATGDTLTGRLQVRYTNRSDAPLNEIYFRLYPNLAGGKTEIEAARLEAAPVQASLEQGGFALKVPLPAPLPPGESRVVALDFSVQVPPEGGGNYGLLRHQGQDWALDTVLPTIAVHDESGWRNQPTPANGDNTFHEAAYYLVQVTAPLEQKLAASGVLVGGESDASSQRALFAAGPARDFYLATSPDYVSASRSSNFTTVNAYSSPELAEQNERVVSLAMDAVRTLRARYGEYPYNELDVVSLDFAARGIEYPGLIGLNGKYYYDLGQNQGAWSPQERFTATIVHEVAHQWFYNLVGNDQNERPWLDEALAQYATWQYIVDRYTEGRTAEGLVNYWRGCFEATGAADLPIGLPSGEYPDSQAYTGAIYCRGPLFILALRDRMGVENFDLFIKEYIAQNYWEVANAADFKALAEEECACDLEGLWDEWVR